MAKEKGLFSKENKKIPAEKIAARIVDFANDEFNQKKDYQSALKTKFNELTKEMSAEQKERVAKYVEGIRLYNYISSVAEYQKETSQRKSKEYYYPEYEDYEYAWSFVVPNEAKRLNRNIRGGAIFYARINVYADLVANILEDKGITKVKNRTKNKEEQTKAVTAACLEVLAHYGIYDKETTTEYLHFIKSVLGKRGAAVTAANKKKAETLAKERQEFPLFADKPEK